MNGEYFIQVSAIQFDDVKRLDQIGWLAKHFDDDQNKFVQLINNDFIRHCCDSSIPGLIEFEERVYTLDQIFDLFLIPDCIITNNETSYLLKDLERLMIGFEVLYKRVIIHTRDGVTPTRLINPYMMRFNLCD